MEALRLNRSWRNLVDRFEPSQGFQLAFITACLTVAWTEVLLYWKHRRSLSSLSQSGSDARDSMTLEIFHSDDLSRSDTVECVQTAVKGIFPDLSPVLARTASESLREGETPLEAVERFDSLRNDSTSPLLLRICLAQAKGTALRQVSVLVALHDSRHPEASQRGLAVTVGVPSAHFKSSDLLEGVQRALKQVMREVH